MAKKFDPEHPDTLHATGVPTKAGPRRLWLQIAAVALVFALVALAYCNG